KHHSLAAARQNKFAIDWKNYTPPEPTFTGERALSHYPLAELARYIDWTPFFQAWELSGRYPKILTDPVVGEAASALYRDATALLSTIIQENLLQAEAVFGFYPAASVGDDVVV